MNRLGCVCGVSCGLRVLVVEALRTRAADGPLHAACVHNVCVLVEEAGLSLQHSRGELRVLKLGPTTPVAIN